MQFFLGVLAALSLLAASTDAQSCVRISEGDLGSTTAPSDVGLLAERLSLDGGDPVAVQLFRFHIVCEVTGLSENMYRHVSVVAEYSLDDVITSSQFEFTCLNPDNIWGLIAQFPLDNTVTTPPDAMFSSTPRSDCLNCLSPDRQGSNAQGVNHCEDCPSGCVGLRQCSGFGPFVTCCNYYDRDGSCTPQCTSPTVPQPDNTCDCPPGTTGALCDVSLNFCDSDPCMNMGTCSSSSNGFSCTCTDDWTGTRCETQVNPCDAMPCANGACTRLSSSTFNCTCPAGLQGSICDADINECNIISNLCLNGGTCQNNLGSYVCQCRGNWEGQDCGRCGISNCSLCSPDGSRCLTCSDGYVINDENTCSIDIPCNPACVNGQCRLGICLCDAGFEGIDCSNMVCPLNFCEECLPGNTACRRCQNGYDANLDGVCILVNPNQINLLDIEIIAIVVGCSIAFILIVTVVVCFITFLFKSVTKRSTHYAKSDEGPKRRKPRKHLVKKPKKKMAGENTTMVNSAVVDMDEEEGYGDKDGGEVTLF